MKNDPPNKKFTYRHFRLKIPAYYTKHPENPFGGFLFQLSKLREKPLHESDKCLFESTFQ